MLYSLSSGSQEAEFREDFSADGLLRQSSQKQPGKTAMSEEGVTKRQVQQEPHLILTRVGALEHQLHLRVLPSEEKGLGFGTLNLQVIG